MLRLLVVFLMLSWPSWAFDPRSVDIIAYRLGMTEAEVTALLERQGFRASGFHRSDTPCPGAPGRRCALDLDARTRDGSLRFVFSPDPVLPTVERISYVFDAKRPNEPEAVERSVLDRYGPPTTQSPMTWCDRRAGTGPCPANAPRLVFEPGAGSSRVLTLSLR